MIVYVYMYVLTSHSTNTAEIVVSVHGKPCCVTVNVLVAYTVAFKVVGSTVI